MISEAIRTIRDRFGQSASLVGNAGSLAGGSVANAGLGFIYWAIAARNFSPESVGYASAAISLMSFAVLVGEFGLGTLLLGEIQRDLKRAPRLAAAVLAGALTMSIVCGGAAIAMCKLLSIELGTISNTRVGVLLFVGACASAGFAIVLDGVLIGFLRSHWQLVRNVGLSVLKLILLVVVMAMAEGNGAELSIFSTWVAATIASIFIVGVLALRNGERIWIRPGFDDLRPHVATALKHHALNIVTLTPTVILPFIVAATLSAEINAAFFAGWMLLGVVLMIPAALTTVLVTVGTKEPDQLGRHMALSLAISTATGVAASVGFYLLGDFVLRLFNPLYPEVMGSSMQYLGLGVLLVMIKYHYIALQRLQQRMLSASVVIGAGALAELTAAIAGARLGGLFGLTWGWMIAVFIEAVLMFPSVLAALPRDQLLRSQAR